MDVDTIAKELVVGYLANHKLLKPEDIKAIAKQLVDFYKATKEELKAEELEDALDVKNYKTPPGGSER